MQTLRMDAEPWVSDLYAYQAYLYADKGDQDTEHNSMVRVLRNIINSPLLTDRQRDVLILRMQDVPLVVIAEQMGVSESVVCRHCHKAINMIDMVMRMVFPRLSDADRQSCNLHVHNHTSARGKNQELTFLGLTTGARE